MGFLSIIPVRDWLYIAAFVILTGGVVMFIHHERGVGAARVEQVRQAEHAAAQAVAASAIATNQAEADRRVKAKQEIIDDTKKKAAAVAAVASSAAAERDGLRHQLSAIAASSRSTPANTGPVASSADQPGADPIGVLAELLGETDRLAGVYAGLADSRRVTAESCERQNDSLGGNN